MSDEKDREDEELRSIKEDHGDEGRPTDDPEADGEGGEDEERGEVLRLGLDPSKDRGGLDISALPKVGEEAAAASRNLEDSLFQARSDVEAIRLAMAAEQAAIDAAHQTVEEQSAAVEYVRLMVEEGRAAEEASRDFVDHSLRHLRAPDLALPDAFEHQARAAREQRERANRMEAMQARQVDALDSLCDGIAALQKIEKDRETVAGERFRWQIGLMAGILIVGVWALFF